MVFRFAIDGAKDNAKSNDGEVHPGRSRILFQTCAIFGLNVRVLLALFDLPFGLPKLLKVSRELHFFVVCQIIHVFLPRCPR